ncbi:flavodoxin [Streptomyces lunaelactis]|uniref:Flavodoxin n=1 Tax=Streptomyces lunaelactis TaxID=1535768 RepID=A0A2R4TD95_9ACTN|nr:flavodoxin [Streptomyces lunaelactis]NUK89075.1 flavodoxin [Streptomyces lunaelactis]
MVPKNGSTAEIADHIATVLRGSGLDADVRPAAEVSDVRPHGLVRLGVALYVGGWHRDARRFARRAEQRLNAEGHIASGGRLKARARGRVARAILEEGRGGDLRDFDCIAAWATGIAAGLAAEAERR